MNMLKNNIEAYVSLKGYKGGSFSSVIYDDFIDYLYHLYGNETNSEVINERRILRYRKNELLEVYQEYPMIKVRMSEYERRRKHHNIIRLSFDKLYPNIIKKIFEREEEPILIRFPKFQEIFICMLEYANEHGFKSYNLNDFVKSVVNWTFGKLDRIPLLYCRINLKAEILKESYDLKMKLFKSYNAASDDIFHNINLLLYDTDRIYYRLNKNTTTDLFLEKWNDSLGGNKIKHYPYNLFYFRSLKFHNGNIKLAKLSCIGNLGSDIRSKRNEL